MDSDDPSLAEVLERLEDVRKGSTLVSRGGQSHSIASDGSPTHGAQVVAGRLSVSANLLSPLVGPTASPAAEAPHL